MYVCMYVCIYVYIHGVNRMMEVCFNLVNIGIAYFHCWSVGMALLAFGESQDQRVHRLFFCVEDV